MTWVQLQDALEGLRDAARAAIVPVLATMTDAGARPPSRAWWHAGGDGVTLYWGDHCSLSVDGRGRINAQHAAHPVPDLPF